MPFPVIFNNLSSGVQPLSDFDQMFNVVGSMAVVSCNATGANTITLAPITNMPTISAYGNYQQFGFVAAANSTGDVTLNVSGAGALIAYAADGVTQLASGSLTAGVYYIFAYNLALSSGAGGFQIVSASSGAPIVLPNGTTATTQTSGDTTGQVATDAFVTVQLAAQNVVTGSRALNTVYQNTSGKSMFVLVTITANANGNFSVFTDSSNPPTTEVSSIGVANTVQGNLTFVVLANNYYKIAPTAAYTLNFWTEWV